MKQIRQWTVQNCALLCQKGTVSMNEKWIRFDVLDVTRCIDLYALQSFLCKSLGVFFCCILKHAQGAETLQKADKSTFKHRERLVKCRLTHLFPPSGRPPLAYEVEGNEANGPSASLFRPSVRYLTLCISVAALFGAGNKDRGSNFPFPSHTGQQHGTPNPPSWSLLYPQ